MIEVNCCLNCNPTLKAAMLNEIHLVSNISFLAIELEYLDEFSTIEKFLNSFDYFGFFKKHFFLIKDFFSKESEELQISVDKLYRDQMEFYTGFDHEKRYYRSEEDFFNSNDIEVSRFLVGQLAKFVSIDYSNFIHNKV